MITALIILSFLLGLCTLFLMLVYAFRPKLRRSRGCTMVAIFGTFGLVIPFIFSAVAVNDHSSPSAGLLWPTSIMLMVGEGDGRASTNLFVFGMAILSNVGLYGFVGLIVGSAWAWIQTSTRRPFGEK